MKEKEDGGGLDSVEMMRRVEADIKEMKEAVEEEKRKRENGLDGRGRGRSRRRCRSRGRGSRGRS